MTRALALTLVVALAGMARADDQPTAFERGLAKFRADDFAGAIEPLAAAHLEDPRDPDAALLLGIAYYRTGRLAESRALLETAERSPDPEASASARVFLGLIAEHDGDADRAQRYYALVASSPSELGASGRMLLEHAGPERWMFALIVRPGFDSNVGLLPLTAAGPGAAGDQPGDAELALIGTLTARPIPALALIVDETLLYRAHAQQSVYDMLADVVGASYTIAGASDRLALGYHLDASLLGGARYEIAHLADVSYHHQIGSGYAGVAHYTFAARDYPMADYAGYTGFTHTGVLEVAWGTPSTPSEASAGYVIERAFTTDPMLSDLGNGGRASLRLRITDGSQLRGSALGLYRLYPGRRDLYVSTDVGLYVDLSRTLGLVLGGTLTRNNSDAVDFDYVKWTVFAGLIVAVAS